MTAAVRLEAVGQQLGRRWVLRDCSLELAEGTVTGVVGPNGAGKSTLLHLIVGLLEPSTGRVEVLGQGGRGSRARAEVAFVPQGAPLPRRHTVDRLVRLTRLLNARWEDGLLRTRLAEIGLQGRERVGDLSGGQRARLALALALARRPRVLVLDEPVASLDPFARRAFLSEVLQTVADDATTIVFSTHLLEDLERTCDTLAVLSGGSIPVAGPLDDILRGHRVLRGASDLPAPPDAIQVVTVGDHTTAVIRTHEPVHPGWRQEQPRLEDVVLAYLARGGRPERHLEAVR